MASCYAANCDATQQQCSNALLVVLVAGVHCTGLLVWVHGTDRLPDRCANMCHCLRPSRLKAARVCCS